MLRKPIPNRPQKNPTEAPVTSPLASQKCQRVQPKMIIKLPQKIPSNPLQMSPNMALKMFRVGR